MKRLVWIIFFVLLIGGCSSEVVEEVKESKKTETITETKEESEDVLFIDDKNFVRYINYIYMNPEEYIGKIIEYEGFIDIQKNPNTGKQYCYCIRIGPGCCQNDSTVGFLLDIDGEFPLDKQWVRVKGYVRRNEKSKNIYVETLDIKVLDEMGEVKVNH